MLHLIMGPAGSGKTESIFQAIAQCKEQDHHPILLLVPEQSSFAYEKKMITLFGYALSQTVEVLSFTRLVHLFEAEYGKISHNPADDGIKLILMQRAIKSVKHLLTAYQKSCSHVEFATNMLHLITELKQSCITPQMLEDTAADIGGTAGAKSQEIALIYSAYQSLMADRFCDPLDQLTSLCEQLERHSYFADKHIFIDAFEFFTEQQYQILAKMMSQAQDVTVTLCTDSKKQDEFAVFANVNSVANRLIRLAKSNGVPVESPHVLDTTHRFQSEQLRRVEQLLRGEEVSPCEGDAVTVCACATAYDECDAIARTIRKMVQTEGYRYRDFAIIARDIHLYQNMLCDALDQYDIAYFADRRVDTGSLVLVRFLSNALGSVCHSFHNDYLFGYLKSPLSPLTQQEASELENYAFVWNKSGRKWLNPFRENPDGADAAMNAEKLAWLESLRQKAVTPLMTLQQNLQAPDTTSRCKAIFTFLQSIGAPKKLKQYCALLKQRGDTLLYDVTVKSWDVIMVALDTLIAVLDDETLTAKEFSELLLSFIESRDIGHVPDRLDEVILGSADRIRTSNPKVTFLMGANFGEFPRTVTSAGLFTYRDRRCLIESGLDIADYSVSGVIDEKFYVYSAACSASEKLFITHHNSSLRGENSSRSEFVTLLMEQLGVAEVQERDSRADKLRSPISAMQLVLEPEYRQYAAALEQYFEKTKNVHHGVITKALSGAQQMHLSHENAVGLFGNTIRMSASRAEVYAKCPFSYFCNFGVQARTLRSAELDVRQKGTLVHFVLEQLVQQYGDTLYAVSDNELKRRISAMTRQFVQEHFGDSDLTDSFTFMVSRIEIVLFHLLRHIGEELQQCEFRPSRFEAQIGGDEIPQLEVPLQEGKLCLGGMVDRVDIFEKDGDTFVRVIDYKTGTKLFSLSEVMHGINMQMLIYLFAILDSDVYPNAKAGGVLYLPAVRGITTASRTDSETDVRREQDKKMRMNGVILSREEVITAMEKDRNGIFIPYSEASKGTKSILSADDFALVEKKVKQMLQKVGDGLHNGDIAIRPLDTKTSDACKYCEYASVCRREPDAPRDQAEHYTLEQTLSILRQEGGVSDATD